MLYLFLLLLETDLNFHSYQYPLLFEQTLNTVTYLPVAADIGKLKEPDTRQKYSIEISNRFEALGSLNSSEDLWKHFKLQTSEAAQLVLDKRSYPKKSWLTNETLQVIEQRRKARLLGDMTTYRRLNGVRNRLIHRDRTQFVARKADEIE